MPQQQWWDGQHDNNVSRMANTTITQLGWASDSNMSRMANVTTMQVGVVGYAHAISDTNKSKETSPKPQL
jgi:hypothetical protein